MRLRSCCARVRLSTQDAAVGTAPSGSVGVPGPVEPGGVSDNVVTVAARKAYAQAGITAGDVDLAVHDATSYCELQATEALGFCAPGEGGAYAESGATALGGERPVNLSGGLVSKGHPARPVWA